MILIALYELVISTRTYITRNEVTYLSEHQTVFTALISIATLTRVSIDVYLYSILGYLVAFFYRKKGQSLRARLRPFNLKSYLVLLCIIALIILNSIYRLMVTIQFARVIQELLSTSIYLQSVAVYVFTLFPLKTFLTASKLTFSSTIKPRRKSR